ncbi:hypothetical protein A2U01_0042590, partial [Trifolium medium]|nr:hypothetical protein [Trifolium medium]
IPNIKLQPVFIQYVAVVLVFSVVRRAYCLSVVILQALSYCFSVVAGFFLVSRHSYIGATAATTEWRSYMEVVAAPYMEVDGGLPLKHPRRFRLLYFVFW